MRQETTSYTSWKLATHLLAAKSLGVDANLHRKSLMFMMAIQCFSRRWKFQERSRSRIYLVWSLLARQTQMCACTNLLTSRHGNSIPQGLNGPFPSFKKDDIGSKYSQKDRVGRDRAEKFGKKRPMDWHYLVIEFKLWRQFNSHLRIKWPFDLTICAPRFCFLFTPLFLRGVNSIGTPPEWR